MQNLYSDLTNLLQHDERLVVKGKLLKNKIIELALQLDATLIKLLLSHSSIREHFFQQVDKVLVFDKIKFHRFVSNKQFLPDNYTAFKNKIGLLADEDFISEGKEVTLAWPYKDCVLEGSQTREDSGKEELFWNETLAPDEIDRLLDSKVLTNFKLYDKKGARAAKSVSSNDNLIIKGNNLLALHSIKKRYAGKVKLIYIDPPYNTGNDSFLYNDSFNHSSWLTFMKSRLEVAKLLLSQEGSIWINIDNNELGYLKVLCDEIFGRHNFISLVSIKRSAPTGHKAINPGPISVTDFLLGYARSKDSWQYKITYSKRGYDSAYSKFIDNYSEDFRKWTFITVNAAISKLKVKSVDDLIAKFPERVIRFAEPNFEGVGKETKELITKSKANPTTILKQTRENHPDIYLIGGQRILFYKDKLKDIDGKLVTAEPLTDFWDDIPFQGIANEGNVVLRKGKKPELLIKRIVEFATDPGDIVLDFFLGSGTTAAVAHKLQRKYIGIEQMEYGKNDAVQRLVLCINGDTTGISKSIRFAGGGSFIYCELWQLNHRYVRMITEANDVKTLRDIAKKVAKEAFLKYHVNPMLLQGTEFDELALDAQKSILLEVLEKNHLYLNLTEIEDKSYAVSADDLSMNRLFYGLQH